MKNGTALGRMAGGLAAIAFGILSIAWASALAIAGGVAALPSRPATAPLACTMLPAKLLGGYITYANAQIVPANAAPAPQAPTSPAGPEHGEGPCHLLFGSVEL